ncbi:MAG TPA: glycosyltransferase [Candidatus Woesearchaeota archaeon]|nr:glycosyltransferase [Candidatus Woesearchaeota archaeon]
MKIAVFSDAFHPQISGVTTFVLNMANYLARDGHEIRIYAPKFPNSSFDDSALPKNISIYRALSFKVITDPNMRISIPNIIKLSNDFTKFNPDVVHIHTPLTLGILGLTIAKSKRKPIVGTYHTYIPDFTCYVSPIAFFKSLTKALFTKFRKKDPKTAKQFLNKWMKLKLFEKKIKSIKNEKHKKEKKKRLVWSITKSHYKHFNILTTPSKVLVDELKKHKINKNIIFLSNGIELDLFKNCSSKKSFKNDQPITLIHVGRIAPEKKVDIILKALKILIDQKYNVKLIIAGFGVSVDDMQKLSKELGIEKYVQFTGKIPRENLPEYYSKADIFITASPIETQGIVVLEAMSCAIPVVGVKKLALNELIKEGYNGVLAEPDDPKDLANQCIKLMRLTPSEYKKYSNNALESVKEHDIKNSMKRLEEIYQMAISNKKISKAKSLYY